MVSGRFKTYYKKELKKIAKWSTERQKMENRAEKVSKIYRGDLVFM